MIEILNFFHKRPCHCWPCQGPWARAPSSSHRQHWSPRSQSSWTTNYWSPRQRSAGRPGTTWTAPTQRLDLVSICLCFTCGGFASAEQVILMLPPLLVWGGSCGLRLVKWSKEAELFVIQMGHTHKVTKAIQWSERIWKTDRQGQVIWHQVNFLGDSKESSFEWKCGNLKLLIKRNPVLKPTVYESVWELNIYVWEGFATVGWLLVITNTK